MSEHPNPTGRFFGGLLMVVGGLMATLAGLCTVMFVGSVVLEMGQGNQTIFGETASFLMLSAVVGGVPIILGVALFFLGRFLWRKSSAPKVEPPGA